MFIYYHWDGILAGESGDSPVVKFSCLMTRCDESRLREVLHKCYRAVRSERCSYSTSSEHCCKEHGEQNVAVCCNHNWLASGFSWGYHAS